MEELIPIFMFMCIAGVLILRPVTKKLGLLIEALAKERMAMVQGHLPTAAVGRTGLDDVQIERITVALERLNSRIDRVDDRLGFMERLVEERPRQRLTG